MSRDESTEQHPIELSEEQNEAVRKGFAGLEAGKKGYTLDQARKIARQRTKDWLRENEAYRATG
jgi:hypothetical protein